MAIKVRCDKCGVGHYVGPGEPEHKCSKGKPARKAAPSTLTDDEKLRRAKALAEARAAVEPPPIQTGVGLLYKCAQCGNAFTPKRKTAQFCSTKCRMRSHRTEK